MIDGLLSTQEHMFDGDKRKEKPFLFLFTESFRGNEPFDWFIVKQIKQLLYKQFSIMNAFDYDIIMKLDVIVSLL